MIEKMVHWPKWAKFLVMWTFGFVFMLAFFSLFLLPPAIWHMVLDIFKWTLMLGILPFCIGGICLSDKLFPFLFKEKHRDF
jgi:hypothetical protein